jgi:hypothetical protein
MGMSVEDLRSALEAGSNCNEMIGCVQNEASGVHLGGLGLGWQIEQTAGPGAAPTAGTSGPSFDIT